MNLSKDQLAQIKAFIGNQPMVDAVLAVLLPAEDFATGVPIEDDAEYGRAVKAWVGARDLIKERIETMRRLSTNPQPAPKNEAR